MEVTPFSECKGNWKDHTSPKRTPSFPAAIRSSGPRELRAQCAGEHCAGGIAACRPPCSAVRMDTALLSLLGFAAVMYITPGPNNVMVASSAANHGIRATLPHMLGIALGFDLMLVLVSAGLGSILLAWPPLLPAMRGSARHGCCGWPGRSPPPLRQDRASGDGCSALSERSVSNGSTRRHG